LQLIDFDCVAATAEYKARDVAITQSLQKVFAVAKSNQNSGILIMIQADFVNVDNAACNTLNITISNVVTEIATGYRNFVTTLITETTNYIGKVVLVQGDSHFYRRCNPFGTLSNIEMVMVPGADDIGWVKATIDANAANIFTFERYASCTVVYSVFNAATDSYFGPLLPGTKIIDPPCTINIQSNITCKDSFDTNMVMLRLRSESTGTVIRTGKERLPPYFLYGDANGVIFGGRIRPGNYTLETSSAGVILPPPMSFMMGSCI
jgi:hypothetical protein